MLLALVCLTLNAAPQGVVVKVNALELAGGATAADAQLVTTAVGSELAKQGYAVVSQGKASAMIAGRLEAVAAGFVVHLTLVNAASETEINDVRIEVPLRSQLQASGTEAAKRLASDIRLTWGVRAKWKG